MINDLAIKNYRTFKDFQIDGLARINLIVGSNNSGKSSLLEAISLLTSSDVAIEMLKMLYDRGEYIYNFDESRMPARPQEGYHINSIFYGRRIEKGTLLTLGSNSLDLSVQIQVERTPESNLQDKIRNRTIGEKQVQYKLELDDDEGGFDENEYDHIDLLKISKISKHELIYERALAPLEDGILYDRRPRRTRGRGKQSSQLLSTNMPEYGDLAVLWDSITLTPDEAKIIQALQILEPKVERISFTSRQTSNSGILIRFSDREFPVPLGSMGDGMRRILALISSLVSVDSGTLLVDEIDTGLHYRVMADMWKLVLETAVDQNAQVFATTHSWDCVRAFQTALNESELADEGKLIRISERGGQLHPVYYTAEELGTAVEQEIEVR